MKILQKQTLVNGKEESTSSQADFLVSLSPSQARERERMITVISGRTCSVLYEKSDPLGLLVKTLLESSQWFSPARRLKWEAKPLFSEKITEKEYCYDKSMLSKPSVKTLSEKDIPSNRCLFRLVPSERPTEETGCGLLHDLLPTPRVVEVVEHPMKAAARTKDRTGTKLNNLSSGATFGLLPTPNAREADKYSKKYNPKSQMGTALTAMAVNGMLPTPTNSMVTYQDFIQAGYHSSKRPDYGLIGRVWLNPPYSRPLIEQFVKRLAEHGNGIALLFNRCDSNMFQDIIFEKATAMKFLRNRIRFFRPDGTRGDSPGCGSNLIAFGEDNAEILRTCNIAGKYIRIN